MNYSEIIEKYDAEKQRGDTRKQQAKQMTKNAKIATEKAKAADLRRKQKIRKTYWLKLTAKYDGRKMPGF